MNNKGFKILKNLSYTLTSNFVSLVISTIITLVLPKVIGVEEYGYWQLYLFYCSYVGFLHFGWNDGIYLKYGGNEYKELNKRLFSSQFYSLLIFQLVIASTIFITINFISLDLNKKLIITMTLLNMVIMNVRNMLLYILQATNRIKEYAQITLIERIFYCGLLIILILIGSKEYKIMILADILGKIVSLFLTLYYCSDIVFVRLAKLNFNIKESINNISVGNKLMLSNIASMLIIGIVRIGIEREWDVATFGKVSLTLSISNMMMIFINAVGLIMYPVLRKTNKNKLPEIYLKLNSIFMVIALGSLILYYPLKNFLLVWLPHYSDGLMYMALLFPICVYEGKMSLLINTYLKTLREERALLRINIISFALSLTLTVLTTIINPNLNVAVLSIVIVLAFKCIYSEIYLSRILGMRIYRTIILESIITIIFILTAWFGTSGIAIGLYMSVYVTYIVIKKKEVNDSLLSLKLFLEA